MTGCLFLENIFGDGLHGFFLGEQWFLRGLHLDMGRGSKMSSDWAEHIFGDAYRYILEVMLRVSV